MILRTPYPISSPPLSEHPRPQACRDDITILNGLWQYAITKDACHPSHFDGEILVPFSPETQLSGVKRHVMPDDYLHYKRTFNVTSDKRCLLHFDAVDCLCDVYVNDQHVGHHIGGYHAFTCDITPQLHQGDNTLYVRVQDVTDTSFYSRGKQKLTPGGMYYPGQSGIYQTVWLEWVDTIYITDFKLTPDVSHQSLTLTVTTSKPSPVTLTVYASQADDLYHQPLISTIIAHQGTIDLSSHLHLWSPADPYLYGLILQCGEDEVKSYFAMRQFGVTDIAKARFMTLNGQPLFCHGVLDQGYYPESLMTPPSDKAMCDDLTLIKDLGFNTIRRHVSIAPMRWYYHCDRLGLLVWQDMVNGGTSYNDAFVTYLPNILTFTGRIISDHHYRLFGREDPASREQYVQELKELIDQLYNVPSLMLWCPFNEGWGQFDAKGITAIIRQKDPHRLIDSTSGWFDQRCGDCYSIHNYFRQLRIRPHRRIVVLSEYGGYNLSIPHHTTSDESYGYKKQTSSEALTTHLAQLIHRDVIRNIPHDLSAAILTQLSDIEEEVNGLITYDRKVVKVDAPTLLALRQEIDAAVKKLRAKDK